jgi:cellulose synthase/poly-beta-1,6-N-acetylglucosamine synthase-like glycosyltransferase
MNFFLYVLVGIILFAYIGYPLTIFIFSIFANHKVKKEAQYFPTVSLLIAAYNEEKIIAEKINNALLTNYAKDKFEIVVVSDESTDKTDEIVKSFSDFGVKLFRVEGRVGKTEARNQAVLMAKSEIIVFSDATGMYESDAISKMVQNFSDESVGMVSGSLKYFEQNEGTMGLATKIYWAYESSIKNAQSKLWTLTGAIGCINAFRRELYHVLPPNIIEDFTEPLMIISQGYRVVFEKEALTYERTTQKPSQEFSMRVRVIRGGMKGFLYGSRFLIKSKNYASFLQLIGHKVLRWLMPIFLLALFLACITSYFYANNAVVTFLLYAQMICYALAILGLKWQIPGKLGKIFSIPTYFLVLNVASLKALYLTITQDLEATWETNIY